MASTVILVRHGKAQGMGEAPSDLMRELTSEGANALAAAYPETFSRLADTPADEIRLWVSPALRAKMTAEIILNTVDAGEVEERESIFFQDVDAVIGELADAFLEEADQTIICVGHVPSMEDIAYEISGNALAFSVGSVAAIEVEPTRLFGVDKRSAGKLLWFERGPEL